MGKGDKRSKKGKIFLGSFGNSRPHRKKKKVSVKVTKPSAPVEQVAETPKKKAPAKKKKKEEGAE